MKSEILEKMTALITVAFGLVAALAWNDAIKALFIGPCDAANAGPLCIFASKGPWVYAIIVTIIAVIITVWLGRLAKKKKDKE